jgi:hypothetical protein
MKILPLLLLLLVGHLCFAQSSKGTDSLRKFSYLITQRIKGQNDSIIRLQGTGFFIREKGKLFLLTAKHVLVPVENDCRKLNYPNDEGIMYINLVTEKGNINGQHIPINVKKIRDTSQCYDIRISPDFISYEITETNNYKIYSIESLIKQLPNKLGEIKIWGYPQKTSSDNNGVYESTGSELLNTKNYYPKTDYFYTSKKDVDYINNMIRLNDLKVNTTYGGYSGSPAFIKDNNTNKWVFYGLMPAIDTPNIVFITKPNLIKVN